mmetsp:Transcript_22830/g.37089  ORF Transcript_22830/g.37089 Transcript_22830/m.37089 type:complete len:203 (+) Transcript_22830:234-842(+)
MLPNIKAKNGVHNLIRNSLHKRVVLVRCSNQLQSIGRNADPNPSRTEHRTGSGLSLELSLHLIHRPKRLINRRLELGANLTLRGLIRGSHLIPEKGVVVMPSSAVADGSGLKGIQLQLEDVHLFLTLGGLVDVGDVCGVVLVMVDLHGGCVDVGFEGLERVEEIGDGVCIGGGGCCDDGGDGGALLQDVSAGVGSGVCFHVH